jgi:hypothetical protein
VSGLGIGLYIASEIVRAHRGTMRAEGEPGEGARFVVEIPLVAIAELTVDPRTSDVPRWPPRARQKLADDPPP